MRIENPQLFQIEEYLKKIGYKIRKPNKSIEYYYIINNRGKYTGLKLLFPNTDSRLEYEPKVGKTTGRRPIFVFYMKDCLMELLDDNCVSFCGKDNRSIFVLLQNFDK